MRYLLTFLLCVLTLSLTAQLSNGSIAPNFTASDIEGNEWSLYDLLDEGKTVILHFDATWNSPGWDYSQTGILQDLYSTFGPDGTGDLYVFYLESEESTTAADLNGTGTATTGDWVSIINYPIIDNASNIFDSYSNTYYPTIYTVFNNGTMNPATGVMEYMLVNSGQVSYPQYIDILELTSPSQTLSADLDGDGCVTSSDLLTLLTQFGECYSSSTCGDLVSHEGYDYSTVQIGEQCWFAENCRYLPSVSPSSEGSETDPYYYVYGYEGTDVASAMSTSNYATYGVLYNWPAVMTEGICPSGWHIPSDEEWQTMEISLGMSESEAASVGWRGTDEGCQMKSTSGWALNANGSNSSGFNGLPGGYCAPGSALGFYGYTGYVLWWSASEANSGSWEHGLSSNYGCSVARYDYIRNQGFSARCVRD